MTIGGELKNSQATVFRTDCTQLATAQLTQALPTVLIDSSDHVSAQVSDVYWASPSGIGETAKQMDPGTGCSGRVDHIHVGNDLGGR